MYTHVNLFIWIFSLYNRTPLYGRLLNTDTSLLRAVFLVPRGSKPSNFPLSVRIDGVWPTQIFWTLYQAAKCPAHNAYVSIWHWISMSHALLSPLSRSGSRIFSRRGCTRLLLYFNTNKPHSFFFCKIPVVLENHRSSRAGGGGCAPPAPSPWIRPCLSTSGSWSHSKHKVLAILELLVEYCWPWQIFSSRSSNALKCCAAEVPHQGRR